MASTVTLPVYLLHHIDVIQPILFLSEVGKNNTIQYIAVSIFLTHLITMAGAF